MFVRVFCWPDSSDLGLHTKAFVDLVLVDLAMPMTLLTIANCEFADLPEEWRPYKGLFMRMTEGPYANVVASNDPNVWAGLWTTNVTNVLLTTAPPPPMSPEHIVYQGAYQAVVVPGTSENGDGNGDLLKTAWQAAGVPTLVLPTLWTGTHSQAIRDALLG